MTSPLTILDCTLRDGGYFNDWRFDKALAKELIDCVVRSGVDIIEVGYKTPATADTGDFGGLFRYCPESQLNFLREHTGSQFAFMVDAKEYQSDGRLDTDTLKATILPAAESAFSWARVASHYNSFDTASELTRHLKAMGYQVAMNLMGMSLLNDAQIERALMLLPTGDLDVFYFADSFGSFEPADVRSYVEKIRKTYQGPLGIHTHDNCGLAFANTLAAIDSGVSYVDATVTGMGRGAGNLKTEQLLLHLFSRAHRSHLNPSALLPVIDMRMRALQQKHGWGWDYTYMLSGLNNIHPSYCQSLRTEARYSMTQIDRVLSAIPAEHRAKFAPSTLREAEESVIQKQTSSDRELHALPQFVPPVLERDVLVLASGASTLEHRDELLSFIEQRQPLVIECNPRDSSFAIAPNHIAAVLNEVRLEAFLRAPRSPRTHLVTGVAALPTADANASTVSVHLGPTANWSDGAVTLPSYVVGMFALMLATACRPTRVFVAGFDGYEPAADPRHLEMIHFWQSFAGRDVLTSLTPTTYPIAVESIYRYLP